ncbi:MAG TPA: 3-hydroxyacyl-CoA dehydrogenase NAD-binding domain-containing protein [Terracidiphilus sp.]|nr:3-hydroxyacyl-CoA dehydrogenase NAD-binding domain-containing protein [Terracidiphilus sp.]
MSETVAIIGAGPLGRWLALQAARGGFRVLLEDVMPHNLHHAQEFLRRQLGPEALGNEHGPGVHFVSTIEDAVREADLAIDCVPDELESKLEIFCLLDRMAPPRTVLATPTTRLSIADLASCTYRPDRCVAIAQEASSLAEGGSREIPIRTTSQTTAETIALLTRFWSRLGFTATFALEAVDSPGIEL